MLAPQLYHTTLTTINSTKPFILTNYNIINKQKSTLTTKNTKLSLFYINCHIINNQKSLKYHNYKKLRPKNKQKITFYPKFFK